MAPRSAQRLCELTHTLCPSDRPCVLFLVTAGSISTNAAPRQPHRCHHLLSLCACWCNRDLHVCNGQQTQPPGIITNAANRLQFVRSLAHLVLPGLIGGAFNQNHRLAQNPCGLTCTPCDRDDGALAKTSNLLRPLCAYLHSLPPRSTVFVPTAETSSLRYFLDMMVELRKPIMFVGGAGVGKTQLVKGKLASLPEEIISLSISFNYFTDVISFQKVGCRSRSMKPLRMKA
eukprot:1157319-Pelagomonas_calceolata.AAC.5